jgi:Putative transposase
LKRRDIRVKTGRFRSKQLFSDLPPKADLTADIVDVSQLIDPRAFAAYLKPLRDSKWVVYCKEPFGGPKQVLAPLHNSKWVVYCKRPFGGPKEVLRYLARYTHGVAISNRRLLACNEKGVTFKWKDYRLEGRARYQVMTLATNEFIRRFLMHVLPAGFHRIRHILLK